MTTGKETVCSLCHGEIGPDVYGRVMCYGCGLEDLIPPERRKAPGSHWLQKPAREDIKAVPQAR